MAIYAHAYTHVHCRYACGYMCTYCYLGGGDPSALARRRRFGLSRLPACSGCLSPRRRPGFHQPPGDFGDPCRLAGSLCQGGGITGGFSHFWGSHFCLPHLPLKHEQTQNAKERKQHSPKMGSHLKQGCATSVIQGNALFIWGGVSLWEALFVSQTWIPFATALPYSLSNGPTAEADRV